MTSSSSDHFCDQQGDCWWRIDLRPTRRHLVDGRKKNNGSCGRAGEGRGFHLQPRRQVQVIYRFSSYSREKV